MNRRANAYEAAFADYLRSLRVAYVAADQSRRSVERGGTLKSVDFVVSPAAPPGHTPTRWLVDVKGRRFPSGRRRPQYWRNWTTADELESLSRWSLRFGSAFRAVLVFAYELVGERSPTPPEQVHFWRGVPYAFLAAEASRYRAASRPLSPRWGTVAVPAAEFRRLAVPVGQLLGDLPLADPLLNEGSNAGATAPRA